MAINVRTLLLVFQYTTTAFASVACPCAEPLLQTEPPLACFACQTQCTITHFKLTVLLNTALCYAVLPLPNAPLAIQQDKPKEAPSTAAVQHTGRQPKQKQLQYTEKPAAASALTTNGTRLVRFFSSYIQQTADPYYTSTQEKVIKQQTQSVLTSVSHSKDCSRISGLAVILVCLA